MMLRLLAILSLIVVACCALPTGVPQISLGQEPAIDAQRYEGIKKSAAHARRLLSNDSAGLGFLATTAIDSSPIVLQEYFAAAMNGDVWMLAMPISANWRAALRDQAATLSIADREGADGAANRGRMYLRLRIERSDASEAREAFVRAHPDSELFLPPNGPHTAFWVRGVVEQVYWFGGFGNEHYVRLRPVRRSLVQIGDIPLDLYRASA